MDCGHTCVSGIGWALVPRIKRDVPIDWLACLGQSQRPGDVRLESKVAVKGLGRTLVDRVVPHLQHKIIVEHRLPQLFSILDQQRHCDLTGCLFFSNTSSLGSHKVY